MTDRRIWLAVLAGLALSTIAVSARADNFVFGASSGEASQGTSGIFGIPPQVLTGDQLILQFADGSTQFAPIGVNPIGSPLFPLAPTTFSAWYNNLGVASGPANDNYIVGNLTQPNLGI